MGTPDFDSPPPTRAPSERELNGDDVARLRSLDNARKNLIAGYGATAESEQATHSDKYGYVYRYDIERYVDEEDDGRMIVHTILVLWTTDCRALSIATYPTFAF
jgi:hypothetical protein